MNYGNDYELGGTMTQWSSSNSDVDDLIGDEDLIADLRRELDQDEIDHLRLSIDDEAAEFTDDPEEQARVALQLERFYDDFEDKVDDASMERTERLTKQGARDFGLEDDKDNVTVTKSMDELIDWYEEELQTIKDQLAGKIRSEIDELRKDMDLSGSTKDLMYADLVDAEVIEQWEPLLF